MTDQELLISALREAGQILCEYLEPGPRNADETITRLKRHWSRIQSFSALAGSPPFRSLA